MKNLEIGGSGWILVTDEPLERCSYCYKDVTIPFYVEKESKTFFCENCIQKRDGLELRKPLPEKLRWKEETNYLLINQVNHKNKIET